LAKNIGQGSERYAVHVKGKEFPAHSPYAKGLMALIYAVGSLGPDHVSSDHDGAIASEPDEIHKGLGIYDKVPNVWEMNFEKAKVLSYSERFVSAIDSFSVCQFCFQTWTIFNAEDLLDLINAVTGWRYTMKELLLLGERRVNLMRIFNEREGFTKSDDILPERMFKDPLKDNGPRSGAVVDMDSFLESRDEYYRINGWDEETGKPSDTKLRELGLDWTIPLRKNLVKGL
jgi:aldehyde:ferredoxin oxidoreductase